MPSFLPEELAHESERTQHGFDSPKWDNSNNKTGIFFSATTLSIGEIPYESFSTSVKLQIHVLLINYDAPTTVSGIQQKWI